MAPTESSFSLCHGCGGGPFDDLVPLLMVVLILLPFLVAFKRLVFGSDEPVVLHLNDD